MHAAESLHWYDRKGSPAYTVKAKAGHDRPTTLADARKLGLCPSVTTIIRCAAAPSLEVWKQRQVLLAALTLPREEGEGDDAYCARIMQDSQEQARAAAAKGTAIHAAIQGHFEGEMPSEDFWPHVKGVTEAVQKWGGGGWTPEKSFAHTLGFGGKVDLSNGPFVLDFKTKEFGPETDLLTWPEHHMQLGAYRHGLGIENARCAIVYVSVTNPGLVLVKEIPEELLQQGWTMFYALLHYWKAKNKFDSAFQRELAA